MKTLIFGSTAAKHWFPDFRDPKDLDTLSPESLMEKDRQNYWYGDSSQWVIDNNVDDRFVDKDTLYAMKAAHFNWDVHWDKTAYDILFFQKKGLVLKHDLYKMFLKDFKAFYGARWASLKDKTSTTFFEDAVIRKYVHDSIHEAVAYYDAPLYFRILKNETSVECSREKFEELSHSDKLKLVREEIFVTALERYLVPNNMRYSKQRAYYQSLKKLTTTMSSGWFSLFIIENFSQLTMHEDDYVQKFLDNENKLILC